MSKSVRILDVGQCGVDGPRIGRFLAERLHARVDRAYTLTEALTLAAQHPYDLVLVNRILDRDRSPGLDVIAALKKASPALRIMLVSDREDAQAEAIKLGALPGFGKSVIDSTETESLLCAAIEDESPETRSPG